MIPRVRRDQIEAHGIRETPARYDNVNGVLIDARYNHRWTTAFHNHEEVHRTLSLTPFGTLLHVLEIASRADGELAQAWIECTIESWSVEEVAATYAEGCTLAAKSPTFFDAFLESLPTAICGDEPYREVFEVIHAVFPVPAVASQAERLARLHVVTLLAQVTMETDCLRKFADPRELTLECFAEYLARDSPHRRLERLLDTISGSRLEEYVARIARDGQAANDAVHEALIASAPFTVVAASDEDRRSFRTAWESFLHVDLNRDDGYRRPTIIGYRLAAKSRQQEPCDVAALLLAEHILPVMAWKTTWMSVASTNEHDDETTWLEGMAYDSDDGITPRSLTAGLESVSINDGMPLRGITRASHILAAWEHAGRLPTILTVSADSADQWREVVGRRRDLGLVTCFVESTYSDATFDRLRHAVASSGRPAVGPDLGWDESGTRIGVLTSGTVYGMMLLAGWTSVMNWDQQCVYEHELTNTLLTDAEIQLLGFLAVTIFSRS